VLWLALFSAWSTSGSLLSLQHARDSFSQQELDAVEASFRFGSGKSHKADFDRLCSTVTQLAHKVDVLVARKHTATVSRPPPEEEYQQSCSLSHLRQSSNIAVTGRETIFDIDREWAPYDTQYEAGRSLRALALLR
jgi:hypothetical protein